MTENACEVVVIGGGAAGLSAALTLGRARRRVVVVDGGPPRNAPAAHMHGYLSRDHLPPAELLHTGRKEVAHYGVEVIDDRVERIARAEPGFKLRLAGGRELTARRVLVATGVRDELPDIPGLRERWGKDLVMCPYCHGYEVRDEALGVLATGPDAVEHALLVRHWSRDVVFFSHTTSPSDRDRTRLEARDVRIVDGKVTGVRSEGDRLTGVELAGGRFVPRVALFIRSLPTPHDELLRKLGCEVGGDGFVTVDETGRTSAAGVWAAGNVVDPRAQVVVAAGQGTHAAGALNADLVTEEVDRAVSAYGGFTPAAEREVRSRTFT
jgi:thioredoxin reductase